MNNHNHIQSFLLSWIEHSLGSAEQRMVDEHLKECPTCREYFAKMTEVLIPAAAAGTHTLTADPFLPTKIRALAGSVRQHGHGAPLALRWMVRTVMFALAVGFGIYMGEELSSTPTRITEQNIIREYSESLQVGGIGDRLQSVTLASTEEAK